MFGRRKVTYHKNPTNAVIWMEGQQILKESHILIGGATGSGKSVLINGLMWTALANTDARIQFIILDLKMGLEMGKYRNLPHTIRFAETEEQAISALDLAINIIHERGNEMKQKGLVMYEGSDIYVVIDEMGHLLQACGNEALNRILYISRIGRAMRVHLLMATQSPQRGKNGIPASIQQNMTCCVGLRCKTAIESRQIIGLNGCETLPRYGYAYMVCGPDCEMIAIPKIDDAVLWERISYWSDPKNYEYTVKEKRRARG